MTAAVSRQRYDAAQARIVIRAGGIITAVLRAEQTLWFVEFVTREWGLVDLVTARKQRRSFRNPNLALKALREMGITLAQVQMEGWDLSAADEPLWRRPDKAASLKAAGKIERETAEPKSRSKKK